MKKLLLILLCLPMIGFGQQTYVPDDNFELALIILGYDNVLDDYVTTASIDTVTYLNLQAQSISDLTGIEAFTALTWLNCENNMLTSLDVSQNTALTILSCQSNYNNNNQQITSLNVSGCTALTELYCSYNNITSLDVSNNTALIRLQCDYNNITSLDVSNNLALDWLACDFNQISTLDVSNNTALTKFTCIANQLTSLDISYNTNIFYFYCAYNQLISLDLRNGNNINFTYFSTSVVPGFSAVGNPNLTCINVDDSIYSTNNWVYGNLPNIVYSIDSTHYFSNHCPGTSPPQPQTYGCTDLLACNYNASANIDDSSCVYPSSNSTSITACDSYAWLVNGQTYTTSGTYTVISTNTSGCDHTETLYLTINSTSSTTTADACDSYLWGITNQTYTNSGIYIQILINIFGCTHIDSLILTINNSTSSTTTADACNSYTWLVNGQTYTTSGTYTDISTNASGCDYTETLYLTINNSAFSTDTQVHCDSYTWVDGVTYTTSNNTATYMFQTVDGCDSLSTLDLIINYSPITSNILGVTNVYFLQTETYSVGQNLTSTFSWYLNSGGVILNGINTNSAEVQWGNNNGTFELYLIETAQNGCSDTVFIDVNVVSSTAIQEYTTNKELLKVTDLLGRETKGTKNQPLFYIYDDGTVEKRIVIE